MGTFESEMIGLIADEINTYHGGKLVSFANEHGLTASTVSYWMNGKRNLCPPAVSKVANALGMHVTRTVDESREKNQSTYNTVVPTGYANPQAMAELKAENATLKECVAESKAVIAKLQEQISFYEKYMSEQSNRAVNIFNKKCESL